MVFIKNFSDIDHKLQALESHDIFSSIQDIDDLRLFMSWHVFAVWDFMSLIKRLQLEFTSLNLPWTPPRFPFIARLINEIVLGEESDEAPGGSYMSHYDLYLLAMKEVGADTSEIVRFVELLGDGKHTNEALAQVSVHPCIRDFVNHTINTALEGNVYQVLGSFFFGREHVIPQMFGSLLESWNIDESTAPVFVYYLKRHIELDGDSHGPAAMKIIKALTEDNPDAMLQIKSAAEEAIEARIRLWDGLARRMPMKLSA